MSSALSAVGWVEQRDSLERDGETQHQSQPTLNKRNQNERKSPSPVGSNESAFSLGPLLTFRFQFFKKPQVALN